MIILVLSSLCPSNYIRVIIVLYITAIVKYIRNTICIIYVCCTYILSKNVLNNVFIITFAILHNDKMRLETFVKLLNFNNSCHSHLNAYKRIIRCTNNTYVIAVNLCWIRICLFDFYPSLLLPHLEMVFFHLHIPQIVFRYLKCNYLTNDGH